MIKLYTIGCPKCSILEKKLDAAHVDYEKVTDKCRHADMYKYMCYIFNSGTFVEYLKDKHRNHWSLEDYNKIQSIQYKHGFRQTTLN